MPMMPTEADLLYMQFLTPLIAAVALQLGVYAVVNLLWMLGHCLVRGSRDSIAPAWRWIQRLGLVVIVTAAIVTMVKLFGLAAFVTATAFTIVFVLATDLQTLMANFAAGLALGLLRPFDVGDIVSTRMGTGTVGDIGFLHTRIDAADNSATYVENRRLLEGTIHNFSLNTCRQVELRLKIRQGVDLKHVIEVLRVRLMTTPYVLNHPQPGIEVLQNDRDGRVIAVRLYCHYDEIWKLHVAAHEMLHHVSEFLSPESAYQICSPVTTDRHGNLSTAGN